VGELGVRHTERFQIEKVVFLSFPAGEIHFRLCRYCFDRYANRYCWGRVRESDSGALHIEWYDSILFPATATSYESYLLKIFLSHLFRMKYKEVYSKVLDVSFALRDILGAESVFGSREVFVGICGINTPDWCATDLACIYNGYVTVPIHHILDQNAIDFIVRDSGIQIVFCNEKNVDQFRKAARRSRNPGTKLKYIIQFEALKQEPEPSKRVKILSLVDLEAQAHALPDRFESKHKWYKWDPDETFTLIYTSGSTGFPKGVIHTHSSWRNSCGWGIATAQFVVVDVSFAPLAHTTPRRAFHVDIRRGGRIVFCRPDVSSTSEPFETNILNLLTNHPIGRTRNFRGSRRYSANDAQVRRWRLKHLPPSTSSKRLISVIGFSGDPVGGPVPPKVLKLLKELDGFKH
jgi:hypothetical protein